jgi:hypothetical protein
MISILDYWQKKRFDVCYKTNIIFNKNHSYSYISLVKSTC